MTENIKRCACCDQLLEPEIKGMSKALQILLLNYRSYTLSKDAIEASIDQIIREIDYLKLARDKDNK